MKLKAGGRPTQKREKIDLDNCRNSDMKQEFRRRADDMVAAVRETGGNPIDQWGDVSSALVTNAKETFGLKPKRRFDHWFNDEYRKAVEEARGARLQWLYDSSPEKEERMKITRRNAKRVIRAAKRRKLDYELRSVEEHGREDNVRQQFQSIKNIRQSYQPRVNMIKSKDGVVLTESSCVKGRWIEYTHSELLNRPPPDVPLVGGDDQGLPGEEEGPSAQEVQAVMQSMKKNKAPGMDEVQIEIFNAAGDETKYWITTVMQTVWEEERMPEEWRDKELVPIHKKGQHLICENYRKLCMLSVGYKIFASILQRRLAPYYSTEVGDY